MDYTLKGSKTMGWDIYGVDDLIAEAYEHWFSFGGEREVKVKVFNTTFAELAPGKITLRLPAGWFYDRETVAVAKIPAFGESAEYTFKVRAPSVCTARRLKPVNFVYESGKTVSTPAAQMVWFQTEPQEKTCLR